MKLKWEKVYRGPFTKKEAKDLVVDIKKVANPKVNSIHDAKTRRRNDTNKYDVYIQTQA